MTAYNPSHFWLLVLILGTGLVGPGQSTCADVEGIEITVRKRSERLVTTPVSTDVILADKLMPGRYVTSQMWPHYRPA